ncbi:MAG TPA: DUF6356 family protein, partial [Reyranella sp.]|nr:DUF6356 family protein [Reyranella sp.]
MQLPWDDFLRSAAFGAKRASRFLPASVHFIAMLRRFTDHPASVNETYLQHLASAFGFGIS